MKVLVTGATGQVGRALMASAPAHATCSGLSHAELDIGSEEAVAASLHLHRPDVIVNAAAYTAVDRAESEQEQAARVNVQGARNLALAARATGARLVHLSTDFVFDGLASTPYRPQAATNPLSVYGRTKRDGEDTVLALLPERSVVLRTAWVYAALGSNFLRTMLRLLAANGVVRVVSDQIGTPTAAHSVARMIWSIVAHPELHGVHHWTDEGVASWYDFAVAIAEEAIALQLLPPTVTVTPITTDQYPTRARRPCFSVLDKTSLGALAPERVHWRVALRAVLREVRSV
jgi:dTDP-4-dehydrorhamnose reductase